MRGTNALLFVEHRIEVVDGRCQTQSYSYRLQHGPEREDWLVRWEYLRHPPGPKYDYPLGHLHVHGTELRGKADLGVAKALGKLHMATGRVPFELVIWQLLAEWRAESREPDWKQLLRSSIEGFEERRQAL